MPELDRILFFCFFYFSDSKKREAKLSELNKATGGKAEYDIALLAR